MFTAFPLFSPPLKIIFIFHRSESNQLNSSPERPFLKEKKLLFQFQIFNQTKPLTLRGNFRVFTKKKIPSLMCGSNSTILNCADTEVALGYTGKERRTRHSTAAYTSFLPRGTVAGSIKLNHFVQQLGSQAGARNTRAAQISSSTTERSKTTSRVTSYLQ